MTGNQEIMRAIGELQSDVKNLSGWLKNGIEKSEEKIGVINILLHGEDIDKPGLIGRVRELEDGHRKQSRMITGLLFLLVGGVEGVKVYLRGKFPGIFGG